MTTSIHYDRIAGLYAVEMNDQIVGATETYHDAEVLLSSIREARHSAVIGGDPLLIEAHRFGERGSICAACVDQAQPCAVCDDRPLLAQCAAVIDSLLGGPVVGGGILDELRRVRAELKREGW